jgi:hypothetical protein
LPRRSRRLDPVLISSAAGTRQRLSGATKSRANENTPPAPTPAPEPPPPSPAPSPFTGLQQGQWRELQNTKLRAVVPNPLPARPSVNVSDNPAEIIAAWSGGWVDHVRSRMGVFGGGHDSNAGNQVYAVAAAPAEPLRIRDHSPHTGSSNSSSALADGTPTSRHTYGGLCYIPPLDAVFMCGGSTCPFGGIDKTLWRFDLTNPTAPSAWTHGPSVAVRETFGFMAQWDSGTGRVFFCDRDHVWSVNPATLADATRGPSVEARNLSDNCSALIDTARRRLLIIDTNGSATAVNLNTGAVSNFAMSGTPTVLRSPGFGHDPESDRYILWSGGSNVHACDPNTGAWEQIAINAGPGAQQPLGTFGRFGYVPTHKVWMLVNDLDQNAFVFRASATSMSARRR